MKLLVLNDTNQLIEAVMSAGVTTTAPDFVCTYADSSSTDFLEAPQTGQMNGITPVTIVSSPAASTRRVINEIVIYNRDSVSITVTVRFVDGANTRILKKVTIVAGGHATLDGVFDASGSLQTTVSSLPASSITGQVAAANGGTGLDTSTSTGVLVVASGTWSTKTNPSGAFVGTTDSQDLSNKNLQDSTTAIVDNSDPTKKLQFQVSPITAGQTRVLTVVDRDDTIATVGGNETFTGNKDFSGAGMRVPDVVAASLPSTIDYLGFDSTAALLNLYDGQRARGIGMQGWQAYAFPLTFSVAGDHSLASVTLAANGGTIIIPFVIYGHMLVQSLTIRNNDTATARSWTWGIYSEPFNNGNSGEKTLNRLIAANGSDAFTPVAGSARTLNAATPGTYLASGAYILAIQNDHPTNNFALGSATVGNAFSSINKTKTISALGSTLDIVTATWSASNTSIAARLSARLGGDTSAW